MVETKQNLKIPQQSIIYIAVCLIGVLIFIFLGIIPSGRTIAELSAKTEDVRFRIEEQRALAPFYQTIQSRSGKKDSEVLPLPAKDKLSQTDIDTLPLVFSAAASKSGMFLVSAIPNPNTMASDDRFLSVNAVLRGEFIDLRKFLINLGAIPYIQHIEEISIQQKPDAREFSLKIWVAVG